ncbi:YybS family protein [Staphylococcus americanisciuri]
MFSKIQFKPMILCTLAWMLVILVVHFIPLLGLIVALFATLPGIILWHRSIYSFGLSALIVFIFATLTGSVATMSFMVIIFAISALIGRMLQMRASKERILYMSTLVASTLMLGIIMILQSTQQLPYAHELLEPYQTVVDQTIALQDLDKASQEVLNASVQQLAIQIPGLLVVAVAIFMFVTLIIICPILRKFKVATPVFRPLFLWHMQRSIFIIYAIALLVGIVTEPATTMNSISINFQIVLGFLLVIQGLSFIHYVCVVNRLHISLSIIFVTLGIIFYPLTRLLGLLDIGLNLKSMINKR